MNLSLSHYCSKTEIKTIWKYIQEISKKRLDLAYMLNIQYTSSIKTVKKYILRVNKIENVIYQIVNKYSKVKNWLSISYYKSMLDGLTNLNKSCAIQLLNTRACI